MHASQSLQSRVTLWDLMACSPPGPSEHGILQAGILEVKVEVAQSVSDSVTRTDHTVHGIVQARILEWLLFPPPGESSWPNLSSVFLIKPKFPAVPALQADYLLLRPQGSPSVQLTSHFSLGLPRDAEAWSLPINTWVLTNRLPLQVKTQTDHNRVKPQTRLTG